MVYHRLFISNTCNLLSYTKSNFTVILYYKAEKYSRVRLRQKLKEKKKMFSNWF